MKQTILIVDDSPIIRYALKAMIEEAGEHTIAGEAENGEQAIMRIAELQPSLVLLDIHMPVMDGEDVLKQAYHENIKFLALSGVNDKSRIASLFNLGISGFLSKEDIATDELSRAIEAVCDNGDVYISPTIFTEEFDQGLKIDDILTNFADKKITKREKAILKLLVEGLSNIEIGEKLFISDRTVGKHRENIMRKAECKNIAELVQYAKNAGFTT
jgi:DNA-binding NarL/FixJ family response regulator